MNDLSENAIDDIEGLDASAAYVASLLANEPPESEFLFCNSTNIIPAYRYLKLFLFLPFSNLAISGCYDLLFPDGFSCSRISDFEI